MLKQILNKKYLMIGLFAVLILLAVACGGKTTPPTTPAVTTPATTTPAATGPAGAPVTIELTAKAMVFDKDTITVPANAQVTLNFRNDDVIAHNFAAYTDSAFTKPIFVGDLFPGPASKTYTFTAPSAPGTYYFRCDIHAFTMKGQFIVK